MAADAMQTDEMSAAGSNEQSDMSSMDMSDDDMDDGDMDDDDMDDGEKDDDDMDDDDMKRATTFRVRIENISSNAMLTTPFAPGVWVVHKKSAPLFKSGQPEPGHGLEALAEDGNPGPLAQYLSSMQQMAGIFNTPAGANGPGPLLPGQAYEFEVTATKKTPRLSFATMFVQSNDLFLAPRPKGIALFRGKNPVSGDVTDKVILWDAGTEVNQEPGVGPDQAPRQAGPNQGAADPNNKVRRVNDGYSYPPVEELVRVTITPVK